MELGAFNTLTIDRLTKVGLFLTDNENDVLLPMKYVPKDYKIGDTLQVFLYLDHEERPVATTLKPYITVGNFAYLKVNYTNEYGAFLDWGLEKDLFVPFKEQANTMERDKRYLVYAYFDEKSKRIVASSRVYRFISNDELEVNEKDEVELIVYSKTTLGWNVIINKKHQGLLYNDDVFSPLRIGDKHKGFIKKIRPDNKIDVTLRKQGFEAAEDHSDKIMEELKMNKGFLKLHDNSHPEEIKSVLNMSKKSFKRAVGILYKERKIRIEDDGIYLIQG